MDVAVFSIENSVKNHMVDKKVFEELKGREVVLVVADRDELSVVLNVGSAGSARYPIGDIRLRFTSLLNTI